MRKTAYIKKTDNPKMGRPKTNRTIALNLKLTQTESEMLEYCIQKTGKTKTDIIVKGIEMVFKEFSSK